MAGHIEKLEVRNRFSGELQFITEIKCKANASPFIKLGLAVRWAVKSGADLSGANLIGHKLAAGNSFAALGIPDGWQAFTYFTDKNTQRVLIGCQDKTLAEGRAYWANKDNRREIFAALDYAEAIGKARRWNVALKRQAA